MVRLLMFVALGVVCACETDRIIFNGPYFVRFTEATGFDKESFTGEINIEVHNAGPALSEDMVVTYAVSGTARQGVDYQILDDSRQVTIPAGQYLGNIRLKLINNANNILRSQTIIFTITSTNQNGIEVGQGASAIGKSYTFTVIDDCILGGTYSGRRSDSNTNYAGLTITSTDCTEYTLSNWNLEVFTTSVPMDLKFIDNGDNTITIPQQEEEEIDTELATIQGSGVVDPTTKQIILTIVLVDFDEKPEVSLTLNPQ